MGKELFKNIPSKVGDLVKDVRNGRIGLPDLQRPFVWRDNKVRELFDSMLKGYPIGYIMVTCPLVPKPIARTIPTADGVSSPTRRSWPVTRPVWISHG